MLQPLQSEYVDRRFDGTKVGLEWGSGSTLRMFRERAAEDTHCVVVVLLQEEYFQQLELSSTLYIGNLSFYTTEDQVGVSAGRQQRTEQKRDPPPRVMTDPGLTQPSS